MAIAQTVRGGLFAEVPVVPEADSVVLLAGCPLALGLVATRGIVSES